MAMARKPTKLWTRFEDSRIATAVSFAGFTIRRFYQDGMMQSVGALTYSTLLALIPILVIAFAIFSAFPAFDAVQARLQDVIYTSLLPETGNDLRVYLDRFTANASDLTVLGVVALALSAILLLNTIESTLNRIWRVERERPLMQRLLVFWALLTFGPLLLGAGFAASSNPLAWLWEWTGVASGGGKLPQWLLMPFAAVVQGAAFTVVFKLVPARPVRLGDAAIGGAIGGIGLEILKWGFDAVMGSASTYTTIYGAVSAVPIFLIWTYACWTVIILGAVIAASLPDWRRGYEMMPDEQLSPRQTLAAAVLVLTVLARQARDGGGSVDHERLSEVIPLAVRDRLVEALRSHGYLVETARGRIALARDLHRVTLAELARDLDLVLGTGPGVPEAPSALVPVLGRLAEAEDEILGRSLEELTAGTGSDQGEALAAVPMTSDGR